MAAPTQRRRGSLTDRIAVLVLFLVGLWIVLGPEFLGWTEEATVSLQRILLGFLFLFFAGAVLERQRLRRRIDEAYEALNMLLYGRSYRRDREAIRILLNGLRSEEEDVRVKSWKNLKKLTGQDFALDVEVWRSWWEANEKRFALKAKRPGD
jgi:hypothetical protein